MMKVFDDDRKLNFVAKVVVDLNLSKLGATKDMLILDTRGTLFPLPWYLAQVNPSNGNIVSLCGYYDFDEMYNALLWHSPPVDKSELLKFILANHVGVVPVTKPDGSNYSKEDFAGQVDEDYAD